MQLLLSIEPKLAFYMTVDDRTARHLDAAMVRNLLGYTESWRFDKEHWLLVSLTSSDRGLAILANETDAQKVADYAEDLYARNHLLAWKRVDCHGSAAHNRWARNTDKENEYFLLLRTLKDRQKRAASAQILNNILVGAPVVLPGREKVTTKPQKVRGQDFTCSCTREKPRRGAQDAPTATSSGRM